jgi:V/A-type H+-transporting ATPase subunit I
VFAVTTILWGALTGSYFAIDTTRWPTLLQGIPWLKDNNHVMWLCFLIGGLHLTVAHLWNAIVLSPSRKALAQIGWIGVIWLMFYVAANLVVGQPMPAAVPWIGGGGVLLIVLFMTDPKDFKEEWINHPMLILNLISCLVDVISYIRLFAVGMASAKIAMNFNEMAMGLPLPPWIKPLGVVLILVLGHGLNLVLSGLSILVHAVRLNTLEFSNHKGLTWSGQPYAPFRKTT